MNFVTLHDTNGDEMDVNLENVIRMEKRTSGGTVIYLLYDGNGMFRVKESLAEIRELRSDFGKFADTLRGGRNRQLRSPEPNQ